MAETDPAQSALEDGAPAKSEPSFKSWLMIVIVFSLVAAGGGGGLGLVLSSMINEQQPAQTQQVEPVKPEAQSEDEETEEAYVAGDVLIDLPPILTNLESDEAIWVRIEASLVFGEDPKADGNKLALEIAGDLLAFLRRVKLVHLTGASGLLHLRTDFLEIAQWRSQGRIKDVVIRTLVVD